MKRNIVATEGKDAGVCYVSKILYRLGVSWYIHISSFQEVSARLDSQRLVYLGKRVSLVKRHLLPRYILPQMRLYSGVPLHLLRAQ